MAWTDFHKSKRLCPRSDASENRRRQNTICRKVPPQCDHSANRRACCAAYGRCCWSWLCAPAAAPAGTPCATRFAARATPTRPQLGPRACVRRLLRRRPARVSASTSAPGRSKPILAIANRSAAGARLMDRSAGSHAKIMPLAVAFEAALGLVALAIGHFTGRPPWEQIDWNLPAIAIASAASIPLLLALSAIIKSPRPWCLRLRQVVDELVVPLFSGFSVVQMALLSLVAGFAEELLFRGLIQA